MMNKIKFLHTRVLGLCIIFGSGGNCGAFVFFIVIGAVLGPAPDDVEAPPVPLHTASCLSILSAANFLEHFEHGIRSEPPPSSSYAP
jgi:hypothetical protein